MNSLWKGNNKGVSTKQPTVRFRSLLSFFFFSRSRFGLSLTHTFSLSFPHSSDKQSPPLQKLFDDLVAAGTIGGATGGDEE